MNTSIFHTALEVMRKPIPADPFERGKHEADLRHHAMLLNIEFARDGLFMANVLQAIDMDADEVRRLIARQAVRDQPAVAA